MKKLWDDLHEPMCAWPIIRFFPISYVKENMTSFTGERDFYYISLRLAEDPNYIIDKSKLRTVDYLAVLYYSGRTLSDDDAIDMLLSKRKNQKINESMGGYQSGRISPNGRRKTSIKKKGRKICTNMMTGAYIRPRRLCTFTRKVPGKG